LTRGLPLKVPGCIGGLRICARNDKPRAPQVVLIPASPIIEYKKQCEVGLVAEDRKIIGRHKLMMENRESVSLTGVTDVISFDEEQVICDTELGVVILKGANLHVSNLNLDAGELDIYGEIVGINYEESVMRGGGKSSFFSKIFK